VDIDDDKIARLRSGEPPIYEPHLRDLMSLCADKLSFTTSYEDAVASADVVFIAVGTPSLSDGTPDLRYLRSAAEGIGATLANEFTVVVNKSTVPVGGGNWVGSIVRDSYEQHPPYAPLSRFQVASNPEFLREGSAILDSLYPDRVVIGSDDVRALDLLSAL